MNEVHSSIAVEFDLGDDVRPGSLELALIAELLPELLQDMLAQQDDQED